MKKPLDKGGAVEEGRFCPMFAADALPCVACSGMFTKILGKFISCFPSGHTFFTNRPYDDDIKNRQEKTR